MAVMTGSIFGLTAVPWMQITSTPSTVLFLLLMEDLQLRSIDLFVGGGSVSVELHQLGWIGYLLFSPSLSTC